VGDELLSGNVTFTGTQGVILENKDNSLYVHFVGEPYGFLWRKDAYEEDVYNRYVSSVTLTVESTVDPRYNAELKLLPDDMGNIRLYTDNVLLYGDALRVIGRSGNLDIRLAKK
jgi:hypothetical protein